VRVFVYEFVTGGGWYGTGAASPPDALVAEGRAMLLALAADFAAIEGVQVDVMRDRRFSALDVPGCKMHDIGDARQESTALASLAAAADWTVVIAPEFDGHLLARTRTVEQVGGRLLGPSPQIVALAGDKHLTAEHLAAAGVPVPRGVALAPGEAPPADFDYPAVLKPRDGAGSQDVRLVDSADEIPGERSAAVRLEAYCGGIAASVASLCAPGDVVPLVPCRQHLSDDGRFTYLGGSLPLEPGLARRAGNLAKRAVSTFDAPLGYLGVDLVLGRDPTGAEDKVIETNPRLTTSYVGLRRFSQVNLAAAMLLIAQGRQFELCWRGGSIQFAASGEISSASGMAGDA
jgi:predicted ATP-grasp superfamily ATP-dependent carboligase